MLFWLIVSIVACEEIAIRLVNDISPEQFAIRHGLEYISQISNLSQYYLFAKTADSMHFNSKRSDVIEWAEPQVPRQLAKRGFPDPNYQQQWHLHDPVVGISAEGAWKRGYTGKGIIISILDDGVEAEHPDIQAKYRTDLSYDVNTRMEKVILESMDTHGTPAAGLAAASTNSVCGVGISYNADIAGIRLLSRPTTDADEARAISYGAKAVDIYSSSWGPPDDGRRLEGPGPLSQMVLEAMVAGHSQHPHIIGRNGKGAIYVWAVGNGKFNHDNCNYDSWANSRYTITVASMSDQAKITPYSEECSAILVTAPSNGEKGITTSDLIGRRGQSGTDCMHGFGGTSASAPIVAGIIGLMLEANPSLTWRDVQHILVHSSSPIASDLGQQTSSGLWYSHNVRYFVYL